MKILVVDDEKDIREILRLLLENAGYEVLEAQDGVAAVGLLGEDRGVDLVIMDIMMPRMSGVEATEKIRAFSTVPVLFLTAKSFDSDKSSAYNAGGDDYLVKPFSAPELLMKVDALTRRYNTYGAKESENTEAIRLAGGVVLFPEKREVMKNGEQIELRDKEYEVLVYLVKNRGRVVGADELYEAVWGEMSLPSSSNNITVHILNLRRKLEDNSSSPKVIRTVWGKGYQVD
ncbi:MAG: response regulator transcription factor [Clostridia bacterium]|nr:response regulator transcription factor [Clostridia bacterium]MBR3681353.1 response regulator transcription factor [Clostridia bacterium]